MRISDWRSDVCSADLRPDRSLTAGLREDGQPSVPEGKTPVESATVGTESSRQADSTVEYSLPLLEISVTGLFVIAVFGALYFAQAILIPVALAFLFNLLLAPLVRRLAHLGDRKSTRLNSSH